MVFLDREWEGNRLRLAVVKPRKTRHLIPEIAKNQLEFCPMQLLRDNSNVLQVLDVEVLTSSADRIDLRNKVGGACEAIFETLETYYDYEPR
jgi:hypothetical protein